MKSIFKVITLISASFAASFTQADNVYQVEVIVFERNSDVMQSDMEAWPKIIELGYPNNWVRLISEQDASTLADANSIQDDSGFSLSSDFLSSIGNGTGESNPAEVTEMETPEADGTSNETPYYRFLDDKYKSLVPERRALDRRGNFRTLFHETWLQPLENGQTGPALVLRGGDLYENHTELEGYIRLKLSRYLHIQTNLWFSQFVPNYGQQSEHWPPLPEFPAKSLTSKDVPVPTTEQNRFGSNTSSEFNFGEYDGANLRYGNDELSIDEQALDAQNDGAYLIKETVVMEQKRRMRSKELHYIDHPKMGMLIVIKPIEDETKQES